MAGFYGTFMGNPAGLLAGLDLPFGGGQQYKQIQQENRPGAPKPTGVSPTRVFPPTAPGREGAIDVQFRQALMPGMFPMGNAGFFMGPQMGQQVPAGFQNKYVS
jgi:hypothetical protein